MPFKTKHGTHYHESPNCPAIAGREVMPCSEGGLEPCSLCYGRGGAHGAAGGSPAGGGGGTPVGGEAGGHMAQAGGDAAAAPVDLSAPIVDAPEPGDVAVAGEMMARMGELYAGGAVSAPRPSLMARAANTIDSAKEFVAKGMTAAQNGLDAAWHSVGALVPIVATFGGSAAATGIAVASRLGLWQRGYWMLGHTTPISMERLPLYMAATAVALLGYAVLRDDRRTYDRGQQLRDRISRRNARMADLSRKMAMRRRIREEGAQMARD